MLHQQQLDKDYVYFLVLRMGLAMQRKELLESRLADPTDWSVFQAGPMAEELRAVSDDLESMQQELQKIARALAKEQ